MFKYISPNSNLTGNLPIVKATIGLDDDLTLLPLFLTLLFNLVHTFFFLPEAKDLKHVSQLYSPSNTIFYGNALRVEKFGALASQSSLAVRFLALAKGKKRTKIPKRRGEHY